MLPDYTLAAEAAYDWFNANGAQFFHPAGASRSCISTTPSTGWIHRTGAASAITRPCSTTHGHGADPRRRTDIFEVLPSLAMIRGQVRDHFSWLHTDVASYTVYFQSEQPGARDRQDHPDEIQIMKNGGQRGRHHPGRLAPK